MEFTAAVFKDYDKRLKKSNALDFDDLLIKSVEIFDKLPATAERYSARFPYVMVDEYQDTNRQQYRLVRHLTSTHSNICVVGDEDQSIYSWRGADIQNILSFEKTFPMCGLSGSSRTIDRRRPFSLRQALWWQTTKCAKAKPVDAKSARRSHYVHAVCGCRRRSHVCGRDDHGYQRSRPDARIAVLYRTNFLSRVLEEKLRRYNLKYRIAGGFSFYERAEIKDLIAYLTIALNPQDSVHVLRVINSPARGIGKSTIDALQDLAVERETSIWEAIGIVIREQRVPLRTVRALEGFHRMVTGFVEVAPELSNAQLLEKIVSESRYLEMLHEEGTEEAMSRVENIRELLTAAEKARSAASLCGIFSITRRWSPIRMRTMKRRR
jgi:DNA helicase-2/ATP-dependent DNA helicase PcrA